jgi:hypothetical protein
MNKVIPTKVWNNISTKLILRWQTFTEFHRKHGIFIHPAGTPGTFTRIELVEIVTLINVCCEVSFLRQLNTTFFYFRPKVGLISSLLLPGR